MEFGPLPQARSGIMPTNYLKKLPDAELVWVVDFFSGCGGMSTGFALTRQSHVRFELLAGIDIDGYSLKTYENNLGALAVKADVRDIASDPDELLRLVPALDPSACRPLVFIGCAPCQGFSAHRKKDPRKDSRNDLMGSFIDICMHFRPDVVVMENVPEILTGKHRSVFLKGAEVLEAGGYSLASDIVDMSLYGVPQRRRRAVVLASLNGAIEIPTPLFTKESAPTVRDAISHLPPIRAGEQHREDAWHKAPAHTERVLERIRATPVDGGDRRSISVKEQLACHAAIDSSSTPGFTDVYGRLHWDRPSVTITAKSSTPSCGRFLHPEQNRNISLREAAILQGFPHGFTFDGPFVHQYRQVGEAVPPLFARSLAWQVLDHLRASAEPASQLTMLKRDRQPAAPGVPAVIDAFCGAGGMSLGFEEAGFEAALAFDIDDDAVSSFRRNVSPVAITADIRSRKLARLLDDAIATRDFVLVGGPPCQGFSQQRRGSADDVRNDLVLKYVRLAEKLQRQPRAVVLENVTYLDSPRGRDFLGKFTTRLERLGFRVFRHDLNSADFGVPQLRKRIVLVGIAGDVAAHYEGPRQITNSRWPTVGDALRGLAEPGDTNLLNHRPSRETAINKRRIAFVDMACGRLSIPPSLQLDCHRKYGGHLDVYGRLDWFSQARTLTGGFDSFTRGEYAHPFRHRSITAREAARLQGFPDWFVFEGNRASVRRQIGNAVPPPLGLAIALGIRDALERKNLAQSTRGRAAK